jgi:hypothetical protein
MSDHVIRFLPLAPSGVPLILALFMAAVYRLIGSRRRLRLGGSLLVVLMLGASTPLWPIPSLPRRSPSWSWSVPWGPEFGLALDLGSAFEPARGALSFLLLVMGAFACWSICRLPAGDGEARRRAAGLPGLLLMLAGGQLAVQSTTPLGGVGGAALVLMGIWLLDLLGLAWRSPRWVMGSFALFMFPLAALGAAVFADPTLAGTSSWWVAGCGAILLVGLLHSALRGSPLLLAGTAQALGVTPLVTWLLLGTGLNEGSRALIVDGGAIVGPVLFALGALNVAVSSSLRELVGAQWVAQIGMLGMLWGTPNLAPALGHVVVSSLLLSLMIGWLAEVSATEHIADLRPFPAPMRRHALAYGLAAASAGGLPLTLGYALRRAIAVEADAAFTVPLLLVGSTLMLCGLLQPLAALIRHRGVDPIPQPPPLQGEGEQVALPRNEDVEQLIPSRERERTRVGAENSIDHNAAGGILLGLVLVLAAPYQLLLELAETLPPVEGAGGMAASLLPHREALVLAGLQIGGALVLLALANRGLRRMEAERVSDRGLIGSGGPGWALPLAGLAEVVAPLTLGFWAVLGNGVLARGGSWRRRALAMVVLGAGLLLIVSWDVWWRP